MDGHDAQRESVLEHVRGLKKNELIQFLGDIGVRDVPTGLRREQLIEMVLEHIDLAIRYRRPSLSDHIERSFRIKVATWLLPIAMGVVVAWYFRGRENSIVESMRPLLPRLIAEADYAPVDLIVRDVCVPGVEFELAYNARSVDSELSERLYDELSRLRLEPSLESQGGVEQAAGRLLFGWHASVAGDPVKAIELLDGVLASQLDVLGAPWFVLRELARANAWLHLGEYDLALASYQSVLERESSHLSARVGEGLCYLMASDFLSAVSAFDMAIMLCTIAPADASSMLLWQCYYRRGFALLQLGRAKDSVHDLRAAQAVLDALAKVELGSHESALKTDTLLASALLLNRQPDEALASLVSAFSRVAKLGIEETVKAAHVVAKQAYVQYRLGRLEASSKGYEEAIALFEKSPDSARAYDLAMVRSNASTVLIALGELQRAGALLALAEEEFRAHYDAGQAKPADEGLMLVLLSVAELREARGDDLKARDAFQEAVLIGERLRSSFDVPRFQVRLAVGRSQLACAQFRTGELQKAFGEAGLAVREMRNVVRDFPQLDYRRELAIALDALGRANMRLRQFGNALVAFEEEVLLWRALYANEPSADSTRRLAKGLINLGLCAAELGDDSGADAALDEACTLLIALVDNDAQGALGVALGNYGARLADRGQIAQAKEKLTQAEGVLRGLVESAGASQYRDLLADTQYNLGRILNSLALESLGSVNFSESVDLLERARATLKSLCGEVATEARKVMLSRVCLSLSHALHNASRGEDAVAAALDAAAGFEGLAGAGEYAVNAAYSYWSACQAASALSNANAIEYGEEAIRLMVEAGAKDSEELSAQLEMMKRVMAELR